MSDRPDVPRIETVESKLSRRELIKRGLALGTVGYVAPMIVGSATKVSAQGVSGLGCQEALPVCTEADPSFCDVEIPCICLPVAGGGIACVDISAVVETDECPADVLSACPNGNDDCDSDEVCVDIESDSSCDDDTCGDDEPFENFCAPLCSVSANLTVAAGAASPRPRTPWRGFKFLR